MSDGKALEFKGAGTKTRNKNGCVVVRKMGEYDFSKGMTIEAWIKRDTKAVRATFAEIVTNTKKDRGPGFRFCVHYNRLVLRSGDGEKAWGAAGGGMVKHQLKNNVWYHVAGTYDGSVFRVYVNGELAGQSKENQQLTRGAGTITIGAFVAGHAYPFDGVIDDVKIYDRAKTAVEILQDAKVNGMALTVDPG